MNDCLYLKLVGTFFIFVFIILPILVNMLVNITITDALISRSQYYDKVVIEFHKEPFNFSPITKVDEKGTPYLLIRLKSSKYIKWRILKHFPIIFRHSSSCFSS